MKCPKCDYTSFDNLEICKNCGYRFPVKTDQIGSKKPKKEFSSPEPGQKSYQTETIQNESFVNIYQKAEPIYSDELEAKEAKNEKPLYTEHLENEEIKSEEPASSNIQKEEALYPESPENTLPPEPLEEYEEKKPETVENLPKGGYWRRLIAFITDLFLIRLLNIPLSFAVKLGFLTGAEIMGLHYESFLDYKEFIVRTIGILLFAAYFIYFHGTTGSTPGKWIFHLKVVRTNGEPLGFLKSTLRFFAYIISALPLYAGFIMIAFNRQKQALHDMILHTYVIKI